MNALNKKLFTVIFTIYNYVLGKIPKDYLSYFNRKRSKKRFQYETRLKGNHIDLGSNLNINSYKHLLIGSHVSIDDGSYFDTFGGIVIGDNSFIGKNCSFYTTDPTEKNYSDSIYIGKNVKIGNQTTFMPGTKVPDNTFVPGGIVLRRDSYSTEQDYKPIENENLVFIVSTGRSGSKSMEKYLSQHPEITCVHEPRSSLIRLSTQYEYGQLTKNEVLTELNYIYNKADFPTKSIYCESDQKLSNLILPLNELFPKAKFIWLLRDGKKVVKSTTIRGWYDEKEMILDKYRGKNKEGWEEYRLQGDLCDAISSAVWQQMTAFEKNCWYWAYWNEKIKTQFNSLPKEQKLIVKLEELGDMSMIIQSFLGVKHSQNLELVHTNKAKKKHKNKNVFQWKDMHEQLFHKHCGELYKKYYTK